MRQGVTLMRQFAIEFGVNSPPLHLQQEEQKKIKINSNNNIIIN